MISAPQNFLVEFLHDKAVFFLKREHSTCYVKSISECFSRRKICNCVPAVFFQHCEIWTWVFISDHAIPQQSSRRSYSLVKQTPSVSRVHPAPGSILISLFSSCYSPVHIPHWGVRHITDRLVKNTTFTHNPIISVRAPNLSSHQTFCVRIHMLACSCDSLIRQLGWWCRRSSHFLHLQTCRWWNTGMAFSLSCCSHLWLPGCKTGVKVGSSKTITNQPCTNSYLWFKHMLEYFIVALCCIRIKDPKTLI